jgi:hypothetical protein
MMAKEIIRIDGTIGFETLKIDAGPKSFSTEAGLDSSVWKKKHALNCISKIRDEPYWKIKKYLKALGYSSFKVGA